jgi:hypothetical protein
VEEKWKEFLRVEGARQMAIQLNGETQAIAEVAHVACWIGDVTFLYI